MSSALKISKQNRRCRELGSEWSPRALLAGVESSPRSYFGKGQFLKKFCFITLKIAILAVS